MYDINIFGSSADYVTIANESTLGLVSAMYLDTSVFSSYGIFMQNSSFYGISAVSLTKVSIEFDFMTIISTDIQIISAIYINQLFIGQNFISILNNDTVNETTIGNATNLTISTNGTDNTALDRSSIIFVDALVQLHACNLISLNINSIYSLEVLNSEFDCLINVGGSAINYIDSVSISFAVFNSYVFYAFEYTSIGYISNIRITNVNASLDVIADVSSTIEKITNVYICNLFVCGHLIQLNDSEDANMTQVSPAINVNITTNATTTPTNINNNGTQIMNITICKTTVTKEPFRFMYISISIIINIDVIWIHYLA